MGNMHSPASNRGGARWCVVETAWGWCGLRREAEGISRCSLPRAERRAAALPVSADGSEAPGDPLLSRAAHLLAAYFEGRPVSFDLPLAPDGITAFSARVLNACAQIPWGETRSYGDIAVMAGSPRGARAAGQALGRNPIPLIVPCHRVIGVNGSLVGFGSGLALKRRMLAFEGIALDL